MAVKAKRLATYLRIALTGPTGSGKTYSAIRLAYGMLKEQHPNWTEDQIWDKIILIDSERGRGKAYSDRDDLPLKTGEYWYIQIDAPYTPQKYMDALDEAVDTVGTEGIIICDSFTHAWSGEGGVLDIKNEMDKKNPVGKYTGWNEVGSLQNKMVNKYLTAPCHVIITMRSKMAYELQQDENGKIRPVKLGLAPVQRGDLEYEFDITLMLGRNHEVDIILKDITFLDSQQFNGVITEDLGKKLIRWLNKGESPKKFAEEEKADVLKQIKDIGAKHPEILTFFKTKFGKDARLTDLTLTEAKNLLRECKEMV